MKYRDFSSLNEDWNDNTSKNLNDYIYIYTLGIKCIKKLSDDK